MFSPFINWLLVVLDLGAHDFHLEIPLHHWFMEHFSLMVFLPSFWILLLSYLHLHLPLNFLNITPHPGVSSQSTAYLLSHPAHFKHSWKYPYPELQMFSSKYISPFHFQTHKYNCLVDTHNILVILKTSQT